VRLDDSWPALPAVRLVRLEGRRGSWSQALRMLRPRSSVDPFRTVTSGGFPASQHASGYETRTFKLLI
jgi:hypothetical protein